MSTGRKRRVLVGGVIACLAVAAVGGAALALAGGAASGDGDGDPSTTTPAATAEVVRRDLIEQQEVDGTLGYGDSRELAFGGPGTITALVAAGTVVDRGGILGEIDGRSIPLLIGDRPLWRVLADGMTDGADVRVLEENLVALGFATESQVGPDEEWTSATAAAVERWQEALGVEETGVVEPGHVVVSTGAVRVAAQQATVGGQAGGPAFTVTGTDRRVTIDLAASYQGLLAADQPVEIELPDGTRVPGRVQSIASVVTPGDPMQGTESTVEVIVVFDDPAASGTLDQAPVDVPDPDGPTTATSSPSSTRRSTPASADTGGSPGYAFSTPSSSKTAIAVTRAPRPRRPRPARRWSG